ncbi:MgtC/SapB family protein [Rhizobium sp. L1K21]|uniref:MgtC/SapB family protein n=1 Tax=Rhizobium sp. L1K21 TaxID=2954933 RepID=UPI002092ADED|nr:MgtC/SapB family protein [Rhizobium sp. L1K21]
MSIDLSLWAQATWLPIDVIASRLLLALVLGAAIGFERELKNRSAGLRTHILVCLASSIIAILTIEIIHEDTLQSDAVRIDPIRLIEAATSGVAFLAAGVIVFAKGEVKGLTTGAGMWLASATGLATGLGYWQVALLATVLALIVLWLLRHIEGLTDNKS